ncbi:hypothetical protein IHE44_0011861 [Lamprotornis superbus]|uniref:BMERB domain-containing protein n=1 Tax=Lamprotornis superbus TaxID=245042 RepID=A0A835NUA9_9PASS|nr:hypothetical protein IHE44_0011861 [Lamprotornis superbus]
MKFGLVRVAGHYLKIYQVSFLAGMGKKDDPRLMQEWFKLVQEKNALVRYESELMIFARELELEDRQSRLQQELRERMAVEDHLKTDEELSEEKRILNEMLEVVEQRDSLVALLEEQRLREKEEDKDLEAPPKSSCGKQGEQKREGRCPSALLHTGETATAGLSLHGHSSETGGLPGFVFVTVLTLENTAVGQWKKMDE